MPLYEYHCRECEQDCELLIRGEEKPHCPTCSSARLEKLLSVPASPSMGGELPMCGPMPMAGGGCGLPRCGMGGCQMEE